MSNYQRLISYIYAYEGGIKGKNIGFAKLETRGAQCRITVSVKRIYVGGNPIGVYLLSGDDELRIGTLFARNGAGEFRTVVNAQNVEGSGCSLEECYGLTVHDTESAWRCYTTIWEDAVAHAAEVELAEVTAKKREQKKSLSISKEIEAEVEQEELERLGILRIKEREAGLVGTPEKTASEMAMETLEEAKAEASEEAGLESEPWTPEEARAEPETLAEAASELAAEATEKAEPEMVMGKMETGAEPEMVMEEMETGAEREEAKADAEPEEMRTETGGVGSEERKKEAEAEEVGEKAEPEEPTAEDSLSGMEAVPDAEKPLPHIPAPETDSRRRLRVVPKERPLTSSIPSPFRKEEETKSEEETWEMLRSRYPKILAFDYEDGCEILTIKPQDIGLLPRENWVYGSNSFLLHGYYYYRYLILARLNQPKGRGRYLLGVPGHYVSNEKYMASMFGFSDFVLSKKQPPKDSRFGYWYTDIKMDQ